MVNVKKNIINVFVHCGVIFVWLGVLAAGGSWLLSYSQRAGDAAVAQTHWPTHSQLQKSVDKPTLLMFVHPRCPCSQASVGELERLMPHLKDKAQVQVVFLQPKDKDTSWAQSKLWEKVGSIPGVQILLDQNEVESTLFGVKTSGQTFFYDEKGVLIYSGGLTAERGHMGDSVGRSYILSFMSEKKQGRWVASVFGCPMKESNALFLSRRVDE